MTDKKLLSIGTGLLLLPYLIWYILGENSYVLIHDNLDSEFVYLKLLLNSEDPLGMRATSMVEPVMNGINRSFFRGGLNLTFLLFSILKPIYAYITHHLAVHLVGFIGMFVLLRSPYFRISGLISLIIALTYAAVPYYHTQYGISISGLPLLFFSFLHILHGSKKIGHWLILGIFPFFSFLPASLPFIAPILLIVPFGFKESPHSIQRYVAAIALFCFLSLASEFNLILGFLADANPSHRTEWNRFTLEPGGRLSFCYDRLKTMVLGTQYHGGYLNAWPIIIALGFSVLVKRPISKALKSCLIAIGLISLWLIVAPFIIRFVFTDVSLFQSFTTDRFYFLLPMLWLIVMSLIAQSLWESGRYKIIGLAALGLVLLSIVRYNRELTYNAKLLIGRTLDEPTFNQFFATDLYDQLKNDIGPRASSNIMNVGLHPSISLYNGMRTLDGYQNNYPQAYKSSFRAIIGGELLKSPEMHTYFDDWGSRCYAFSSEVGLDFIHHKSKTKTIRHLDFDFDVAKSMGCQYILSSVEIVDESNLVLFKHYESKNSFWKLWLYQIRSQSI